MTVGKKIKDLRLKNQMTQEELAQELHVTRNAISKWETDKGLPNIDSLIILSKIFNVSLDYLFGEEEIIKATIENINKTESNKNSLSSIIIFILFALIGTFIPYFLFKIDSSSVMVTLLIILPMVYLLLGIISVLTSAPISYISISSALAMVPIYVFFDLFLPNVSLGVWGLVYYAIFLISHILLSKILTRNLGKKVLRNFKLLFLILSIVNAGAFLFHTVYQVIKTLQCEWCSAPWYTAIVINIFIYIVPFTAALTLYIYYKKKNNSGVIK